MAGPGQGQEGTRRRSWLRAGRGGSAARRAVRLALWSFFVMGALLLAASLWVRREVGPFLHEQPELVPPRSLALVLGASVRRSGKPSPVAEARLAAALALYRSKQVSRILVSGDHQPDEYDEAESMRRWLLRAGVPPGHILVDRGGVRTFESMQRAVRLFGVREAVVCTQAFHLPRAVFLARRAGIDAVGLRSGGGLLASGLRDLFRESLATVRAILDAYLA